MRISFLPSLKKHLVNGSPVWLGIQLQIGLWLTTWHLALIPHVPGHGSTHLLFRHAWVRGHSALTTHSGLQVGGLPICPGWHEHTAISFTILHKLFEPQGDGLHGSLGTSTNMYNVWYGFQKFLFKSPDVTSLHKTNGSPLYFGWQLHMGIWLTISQIALAPHVPMQGSTHLRLLQALFGEQSVFMVHSGLQPKYGSPWYSGKQVQAPLLHLEFVPHGDGLHGSSLLGFWGSEAKNENSCKVI